MGEEKNGRYERYCTTILSLMRERCIVTGDYWLVTGEHWAVLVQWWWRRRRRRLRWWWLLSHRVNLRRETRALKSRQPGSVSVSIRRTISHQLRKLTDRPLYGPQARSAAQGTSAQRHNYWSPHSSSRRACITANFTALTELLILWCVTFYCAVRYFCVKTYCAVAVPVR